MESPVSKLQVVAVIIFATLCVAAGESLLSAGMYLFQNAFQFFKMGYACAMAWLMFVVIILATVVVFKTSARYVYYGGDAK